MTPYDHKSHGAGPAPYDSGQAFFLISKGDFLLNLNYKILEIEKNFTIDIKKKQLHKL